VPPLKGGQAASGMSKDAASLSGDIGLPRQPIEPEKVVLRIIDGLFRAIGDRQRNIPGIGQAARDPIVGRDLALLGASGGDDNSRVDPWGVRPGDLRCEAYRTIMQLYALGDRHRDASHLQGCSGEGT